MRSPKSGSQMKISQYALKRLGEHTTGDAKMSPYRSGPNLVSFFNAYGADDVYPMGGGFPSRWAYAEAKLTAINDTPQMAEAIEAVFDPLVFERGNIEVQPAVDDMNKYLRRDGLQVVIVDGAAKVRTLSGNAVRFAAPPIAHPSSMEFIRENVEKCERKLREGDDRGAITNARSLCEDVLVDIERQLDPAATAYDGDLVKLYKRVRKLLHMEPSDYDKDGPVTQLLRGLVTVVDGLAGMSNALGDRHGGGGGAKPKPHHAALLVNAANTLCTFVSASFEAQRSKKTS
jgi:hypothetical protein